MTIKQKTNEIIKRLEKRYHDAKCSLDYNHPHELLIATRLSAQCTDKRVNIITKELFNKYKSISDFANAKVADVETIVKSCGLYKTKAKDIVLMSKMLLSDFNGKIPDEISELIKLPGVGRKTANLIIGEIYNKPAVVTDTHVIRISNRLGLANSKNPEKVEQQLKKLLPKEKSTKFCHQMVLFGRDICKAQNPRCQQCDLNDVCKYYSTK